MNERQPPKFDLGDFTLRAISDGLYRLDGGAMFGVVPKVMWEKVKPPDERNRIDMCLTCLLVERKDELILIEAGIGNKNPAKFNDIYGLDRITTIDEELKRIGRSPEDIKHVILTHLHFDHAGSLTILNQDGKLVPHFPNARHHIHSIEWETAKNPHARNRASYLANDWMPIFEAGLIEIHKEDSFTALPGITCERVGGHTPGLIIVNIESSTPGHQGISTAVFPGDLIPTGAHVPVPWIMGYDLDPTSIIDIKERLLPIWMKQKTLVVFVHETRYPWGTIKQDEKGQYQVEPLDSNWLEPLRRIPWPQMPQ